MKKFNWRKPFCKPLHISLDRSSRIKLNSPKTLHKTKISAIYGEYAETLLRKRFRFYACFYFLNLLFILITSLLNFDVNNVPRMVLILILMVLLVLFSFSLSYVVKFPHIIKVYFVVVNILGTLILTDISRKNLDFSLPEGFFYQFWMGYRLCAISFITKVVTRSFSITISTLLFELVYIVIRCNEEIEESYKSIVISVLILGMLGYFFYVFEKFLLDDSQVKHYQREDNKLFKKMLNRLPEALIILSQDDHLFYSNYNAKNFIYNCSKTMVHDHLKERNAEILQELFQNLNISLTEDEKSPENIKLENSFYNKDNSKGSLEEWHTPYLFMKNEKDVNENKSNADKFSVLPQSLHLSKAISAGTVESKIKEANLKTLHDLYQYFKQNLTKVSDPIIQSLLKTHQDNIAFDRYKKENYFTLELYHDSENDDQMSPLIKELRKYNTELGQRSFYNVQMSIIEIREQLHFVFLFDDITLSKKISQIQNDAIIYKDLLMASVSHELRTPLNGIINLIEHATSESSNEITEKLLFPALNSSKLLLSIISDFLDYSMINANKLRLVFTQFNLKEACADCVQLIMPQAKMKNILIKFQFKQFPSEVIKSEPNRLKQVILNLLNNAIRFTNQNGNIIFSVSPSPNRRKVRFTIKDSGIGISFEEKARIERIIKEENFLTKVNKNSTGAGLGLKISSKLINLLNMSPTLNEMSLYHGLICQSEVGKGSIFSFEIYDHGSNDLSSISESRLFESSTKNYRGGVFIVTRREKENEENFQRIEETSQESQFGEEYGVFEEEKIVTSTFQNLDTENEGKGNGQGERTRTQTTKNMQQVSKKEVYRFFKTNSENNLTNENNALLSEMSYRVKTKSAMDFCEKSSEQNHALPEKSKFLQKSLCKIEEKDRDAEKIVSQREIKLSPKAKEFERGSFLIVDDDFYNIEVLRLFLKSMDYCCDFANNGKEAIEKFEKKISQNSKYLMILMDFNMPVMDGIEATRLITEKIIKESLENTPIIGITAYISQEDRNKGMMAGMREVLEKPIKKEGLKAVLEKYLEKKNEENNDFNWVI